VTHTETIKWLGDRIYRLEMEQQGHVARRDEDGVNNSQVIIDEIKLIREAIQSPVLSAD